MTDAPQQEAVEDRKVLVVYYSRTGTTRKVAEQIAAALGAEIEELADLKKRAGVIGFLRGAFDGLRKKTATLADTRHNPADYTLVVVGTPVWAGNMTPAVRAWLAAHADRLPDVAFFCTTGGSGIARTFAGMAALAGKDALATLALTAGQVKKDTTADKLAEFTGALTP